MKLGKKDVVILVVWALIIFFSMPAAAIYSHYITYQSPQTLTGQSALVQKIISNTTLNNAMVVVVVNESPSASLANKTLEFQAAVSHLPWVNTTSSPFSVYQDILTNYTHNSTFAKEWVEKYGLKGAPEFVFSEFVSKDNSSFLIFINFNYTSGLTLKNGETPSENVTPKIEKLVSEYFGSKAYLTGDGPISYDLGLLITKYLIIFPILYVVLTAAIGIYFRSIKLALLGLVFIFLTSFFGYVAIYITGVLIGNVYYTVQYIINSLLIGITTDYFVYMMYKFRHGRNEEDATRQIYKASKSVAIAGVTIAAGLGTYAFIKGFLTWGVSLALSVLLTVAFMATFIPVIAKGLGKRLLPKTIRDVDYRKSRFYKVANIRRKWAVVGLIIVLAIPAIVFFYTMPVTFNFAVGLPNSLRSVQGFNLLDKDFGQYLYPIIVLVNNSAQLRQDAITILNTPGVYSVVGPYVVGDKIINQSEVSAFKVGDYYYYLAYTKYSPYSQQALDIVKNLRAHGFLVGGTSAIVIDEQSKVLTDFWKFELLVTAMVALVIGLAFRSWKYPLIAISGVFISITWSTSLLWVISNYVFHQALLYLIPLILYIILMTLGSDYTVFILSSFKEEEEVNPYESAQLAIAKTGRIVTALGLILAISIGVLAVVPIGMFMQQGLAFIISLILDTFVIRTFYFPAMLRILHGKT